MDEDESIENEDGASGEESDVDEEEEEEEDSVPTKQSSKKTQPVEESDEEDEDEEDSGEDLPKKGKARFLSLIQKCELRILIVAFEPFNKSRRERSTNLKKAQMKMMMKMRMRMRRYFRTRFWLLFDLF